MAAITSVIVDQGEVYGVSNERRTTDGSPCFAIRTKGATLQMVQYDGSRRRIEALSGRDDQTHAAQFLTLAQAEFLHVALGEAIARARCERRAVAI